MTFFKTYLKYCLALSVILVLVANTSCITIKVRPQGSSANQQSSPEAIPEPAVLDPFTFNYDADSKPFLFEGDSVVTLTCCAPIYQGMHPLPGQLTYEFDDAWNDKISELQTEARNIVQTVQNIRPKVAEMRGVFLNFTTTCLGYESNLQGFTAETMNELVRFAADEAAAEAQYNSTLNVNSVNAYYDSFMNYLQIEKAVELGGLYLQDVNNILAYSGMAYAGLENHSSSSIKEARKILDQNLKALDPLADDLQKIVISIEKIDYGFKQFETGNYYFALAADDFIQSNLPDIKAKVNDLQPDANLTREDIDFIKTYIEVFEQWQSGLIEQVKTTNQGDLIIVEQSGSDEYELVGKVYAEEGEEHFERLAYRYLKAPAQSTGQQEKGYLAQGWDAVKQAAKDTKQSFQNMLKPGAVILDTLAATAKTIGDLCYGGTSQVTSNIKDNYTQVVTNFNNGVSGATVFKDAHDYLEMPENAAENAVKNAAGNGKIGKVGGFFAKNTVGLFTSFGKGMVSLYNPNSTAGDLAEGSLDVLGSCLGGSKVIGKASQVPGLIKGGVSTAKTLTGKVGQALKILETKLTSSGKVGFVSNGLNGSLIKLTKDEILQGMVRQQGLLTQQLKEQFKEGTKSAIRSSKETLKESVKDMFEKNLTTVGDGIITTIGNRGGTYLDNVFGNWIDDQAKTLAKNTIDNGVASFASQEEIEAEQQKKNLIADLLSNIGNLIDRVSSIVQNVQENPVGIINTPGELTSDEPIADSSFKKIVLDKSIFVSGTGVSSLEGVSGFEEAAKEYMRVAFKDMTIEVGGPEVNYSRKSPISMTQEGVTYNGNSTITIDGTYDHGTLSGKFNVTAVYDVKLNEDAIMPFDITYYGNFTSEDLQSVPNGQDTILTFNGELRSKALVELLVGIAGALAAAGNENANVPTPTSSVICESYKAEVSFMVHQ